MNNKGKVAGITGLIGNIVTLLSSLLCIYVVYASIVLVLGLAESAGAGSAMGTIIIAMLPAFLVVIARIVLSIIGIVKSAKGMKGQSLKALAIINIVTSAILLLSFILIGGSIITIIVDVIALALLIVSTVFGFIGNKKATEAPVAEAAPEATETTENN